MKQANNTGEWEEIFDNAQTMHLQEFINHYSPSTETGQQGNQEFLQMQFPGKDGSDIHKPTEEQEQAELAYVLQIPQPQEGQDELWEEILSQLHPYFLKEDYELFKKQFQQQFTLIKK